MTVYEVVRKLGLVNYTVKRLGGQKTWVVHVDRLRPGRRHRAKKRNKVEGREDVDDSLVSGRPNATSARTSFPSFIGRVYRIVGIVHDEISSDQFTDDYTFPMTSLN